MHNLKEIRSFTPINRQRLEIAGQDPDWLEVLHGHFCIVWIKRRLHTDRLRIRRTIDRDPIRFCPRIDLQSARSIQDKTRLIECRDLKIRRFFNITQRINDHRLWNFRPKDNHRLLQCLDGDPFNAVVEDIIQSLLAHRLARQVDQDVRAAAPFNLEAVLISRVSPDSKHAATIRMLRRHQKPLITTPATQFHFAHPRSGHHGRSEIGKIDTIDPDVAQSIQTKIFVRSRTLDD